MMTFVTQDEAVISDAVHSLEFGKPLRRPVPVAGGSIILAGRVTRFTNLANGPRGERRAEIETDDE